MDETPGIECKQTSRNANATNKVHTNFNKRKRKKLDIQTSRKVNARKRVNTNV